MIKRIAPLLCLLIQGYAVGQTYPYFPPPGLSYTKSTATITCNQPASTTAACVSASGASPGEPIFEWIDNASAASNKRWWAYAASGVYSVCAVDDSGVVGQCGLQVTRSGTNTTQSTLVAGAKSLSIKSTGDVQVNGSSGTSGQPLVSAGAGASAGWSALTVPGGGTGAITLTSHGVLIGEGATAVSAVAAMAADTLLQGQGTGADPAGVAINNCGSGTQALSYSTSTHTFGCQTITGGGTPTTLQGTASSTNASYPIYGANGTTPVYDSTFAVSINPGLHTMAATTFTGNATSCTLAATLTTTQSTTNANYPPALANGTTIQWDSGVLINPSTHTVTATLFSGAHLLTVTTVASLPTCNAGTKGSLYAVSDASAPTYNSTVTGGGAVSIPAYCNGTNWTAH